MRRRWWSLGAATLLLAAACTSSTEDTATTQQQATPTAAAQPSISISVPEEAIVGIDAATGAGDPLFPSLGNGGYDAQHYTVDLTWQPEATTVSGRVTMTAIAIEPLASFSMDASGLTIDAVTIDGERASFSRIRPELVIMAEPAIASGRTFEVDIEYSANPQPIRSEAIPIPLGWRVADDGTTFTLGEPGGTSTWLPVSEHPSDKATYDFVLRVPRGRFAAASGRLLDIRDEQGLLVHRWRSDAPLATYNMTIVTGEFSIVERATTPSGVVVRHVLPPDLVTDPPDALSLVDDMITYFEGLFGPYPFEEFGIVVVPEFVTALETQTLSIFGRRVVESDAFEAALAHEIAHQWFGDSVTPVDWSHIWLNEGFARYAEFLWSEQRGDPETTAAQLRAVRNAAADRGMGPPGSPSADALFDASVYIRGALVVHALRLELGDATFFDSLRRYAELFRHGNASTQDLLDTVQVVAGRSVEDVVNRFLYDEVVPELP